MASGDVFSTGELICWVWPCKGSFDTAEYRRVRAAAAEVADPVCRAETNGRPWLWRLKSDGR
jgi:hypothetical protein